MTKPLFITFEGGEGCGKSVQSKALYDKLAKLDIPAVLTHEPGGTQLGEKLTGLLKWGTETDISPVAEVMLFNASRSQLVEQVIKPSLNEGKTIICDRFADSTIAYQGYGRGLNLTMIKTINDIARQGLSPDITILLDLPVEVGFSRKNGERDRFEQADKTFHERVRKGFLDMAALEPGRWLIINADQPVAVVEQEIWDKLNKRLGVNGD